MKVWIVEMGAWSDASIDCVRFSEAEAICEAFRLIDAGAHQLSVYETDENGDDVKNTMALNHVDGGFSGPPYGFIRRVENKWVEVPRP